MPKHPTPRRYSTSNFGQEGEWMFWAFVGPELVLSVAIGQYASARRSLSRFRELGYRQWTLPHAFFADRGGILLEPKDSTPFLIDGRQLACLLQKKYLSYSNISDEKIWDKPKADTLRKVFTLIQGTWLIFELVGRAISHLAISALELSAGAIVFYTFGTVICWLHKPMDVRKGIVLTTDLTTAQILMEASDAAAIPYRHTPLNFVAKQSFTFNYDVTTGKGLCGAFRMTTSPISAHSRSLHDDSSRLVAPYRMAIHFSKASGVVPMAHCKLDCNGHDCILLGV